MINRKSIYQILALVFFGSLTCIAGNPDRQGESGAGELLFNPWAVSAGVHSLNTSSTSGVEAMRINVAGLGRLDGSQLNISQTRLFEGTDLKLNSLGFVSKMGENGAFGISLVAVDFGDIPVTTTDQPEGTGSTYSPSFFHLGLGYSHTYANKISVGILFRGISESLTSVSAFGFALDAGVQYVSGDNDEFKLGISLRNIGSPMQFGGEGLTFDVQEPDGEDYLISFDTRAQDFELPSMLNIGLSYDFIFSDDVKLRAIGNFTSNSFSRDNLGAGLELFILDYLVLRGAYRSELGETLEGENNVYSGLAGGISLDLPLSSDSGRKVGVDYAYRATNPFNGTHNFSVRLNF